MAGLWAIQVETLTGVPLHGGSRVRRDFPKKNWTSEPMAGLWAIQVETLTGVPPHGGSRARRDFPEEDTNLCQRSRCG